jgi:hypothetical protein
MQNFGTLSTLGRTQALFNMTDLNTTRLSALAALYGIDGASEATLSRALKGGKNLNHGTDEALGILVSKIESLIQKAAPITISFREPDRVKGWLDDLEAGTLFFVVVDGVEAESK